MKFEAKPSISCYNIATPGGWDESASHITTGSDPNKTKYPRNPSNKGPTNASGPVVQYSNPELFSLVCTLEKESHAVDNAHEIQPTPIKTTHAQKVGSSKTGSVDIF